MEIGYSKPVNYLNSDYMHNMNIKMEPDTCDYGYIQYPARMSEKKLSALRNRTVLSESDPLQLTSWTTKHPQNWSKKEVLDWIFSVVEQEHLDGSKLQGEAYRNFSGDQLCKMNKKEFQRVDPYYGTKMYETFRNLINDVSFEEPKQSPDPTCLDFFNLANSNEFNSLNKNINDGLSGRLQHLNVNNRQSNGLRVFQTEDDIKVDLPCMGVYTIATDIEFPQSSTSSSSHLPQRLTSAASFTYPPMSLTSSHCPDLPTFNASFNSSLPSSSSSLSSSCLMPSSSSSSSSRPRSASSTYSATTSAPSAAYPHVFPPTSLNPGRGGSSSLMPMSRSYSLASQAAASSSTSAGSLHFQLPFVVPHTSSLSSSSTSSSPPPCRIDKSDPGYGSDDSMSGTSFMPPFHPASRHDFAPGSLVDDVDINNRPVFGVPPSYSDDVMRESGIEEKKVTGKKNKNNATKNGNHLWEFVRDLLRDPKTNPKLLKWEDKENGVFRFVQSEKVAQLWGEKKNNPLMTYEKLSRAMRFCRTAGYFDAVPKNGKFPKKLCFMFGEKAQGWKD